jgi:hypothetical protein
MNESSLARLRRSQKLEILPSPNSKSLGAYFLGAYIFCKARRFQRPFCYYGILWGANILDVAHIFYICADILDGRECFIGTNISWARIFWMCADILHVSKYFGYAQIFQDLRIYFDCKRIFWYAQIFWDVHIHFDWKRIFWCAQIFWDVRIHFWLEANILCVNYYFRQAPIFNDFAVSSAQFYFCNKFCFDFFCKYFCIFSVSIYACCVRQYFWRKFFEA